MSTSAKSLMNMINARTKRVKYKKLRAVHGKIILLMEIETLHDYKAHELTFPDMNACFEYLKTILNFTRYELS